ncbi:MAG: undecaprenyldiphospho-muramoylpentapeptide beta-N-acetylglucosaminyltransferase [Actinomycetota bacterium]|nr:undecaprenyldiphospho-muramoylpentapeptide beta-N-acetylglucosaminyltransferase [Actinomycetota bacterium]
MKVLLAGGGTAGHVVPAIALAHALKNEDLLFLGTSTGAESKLVPAAGFSLETIDVRGFDRSRPASIVPTGLRAIAAVAAARSIVARFRPDVVVGMGGYVSLPACLAARSLRVPVVLHEQNIVLGLANRVCKPLARKVAVSFEATLQEVGERGVFVGNPVLPEIASFDRDRLREVSFANLGLDPARDTLLVFGGSQGASRINSAAAGLAARWNQRADRQVLHITGRTHEERVSERVQVDGGALVYRVTGYVERMVDAYAVADLTLCRGGATTVAELGVVGLPSIIVPYPHHRDRQQERHALVLEDAGAARLLPDAQVTSESVAQLADALLDDPSSLDRMSRAARALGRPAAAEDLARTVLEVAA